MSSSTASSFWKLQASATVPGKARETSATISSALIASTSEASGSVNVLAATEEHLLQRVAAETQAERLERDHLVRRDVPEVDRRPELLHEPRLGRLRRRLEDDVRGADDVGDVGDQLGAHAAVRVEDAGRAALARLGDDLPGARFELLVEPRRPLVDRVLDARVLRADLGENGEIAREVGDQLELALARDVDRPVGDLDMREAQVLQPRLVVVEPALRVDDLEERAAEDDGLVAQHVQLALEALRHVRRAPAELDDRDVLAGDLEDVLPRARAEALVDHVGQADVAADAEIKGGHRAPRASPSRGSARRDRASCRARRSRPSA